MQGISEEILVEGLPYTIELSTGTLFQNVVYSGTKYLNGKNILVFYTKDNRQLSVNPSFHTFTAEELVEEEDEE